MNRLEKIGLIAVVGCFIFATAMSLYHISYDGLLGITKESWNLVWAITENGFPIFLLIILSLLISKFKYIFRLFAFYFIMRLGYHVCCYCSIYVMSEVSWIDFWSAELVIFSLIAAFSCLLTLKPKS